VGVYSLEELVTRDSRVCVVNILGTESRKVTPVSHEYSGGNVVAGVQYGRRGVLETRIGNIPVFRSLRDVMEEGIHFDIGVIYLPPPAVSQAAWELVSFNKNLKRIVIVTEKVPTRDSRNIRFICQDGGVDVIGANCLGVANAWDHVRVGGALGGDNPEETLKIGSIAIHSNSGNFTTTIAEYLRTAGFGITTAVSSGKDVYIHFALPEFLYAAQNDPRTRAVALYVEPGGYYEKQALEWIEERRFGFNKPIVVCVTGRWKKDIVRSCGHAGAMAGSGDDAESKEKWFDDYFGMGVFDPQKPEVSKRGVRVASIQHIPAAMAAVFEKMDEKPDFESSGDLNLKLWVSDNMIQVPRELNIPVVQAMPPYDKQISEINKQVGAHYLRQNMRNKSGASRMDPETQVSELHGKPVLDLATRSVEENIYFSIAKVIPSATDLKTMNVLLNLFLKLDDGSMDCLERNRQNETTPNAYLAAHLATMGNHPLTAKVKEKIVFIIDVLREFQHVKGDIQYPKELDKLIQSRLLTKKQTECDEVCLTLQKLVQDRPTRCNAFQFCQHTLELAEKNKMQIIDLKEFLIASLAVCIFWKPMLEKRISRQVVEDSVTYLYILSRIVAYSVVNPENNKHWQKLTSQKLENLRESFTDHIFRILFNRKPNETESVELQYLLGLTITNGPGTISAKGAKESVSARNAIPLAFVGFLTNTGLAHGGNGFEAVDYLLENFKDRNLKDPGDQQKDLNLKKLANAAAKTYGRYKQEEKDLGKMEYRRIPCIGHPVFKGAKINVDPREDFIQKRLSERGIYNVFLDFYHLLVKELFNEGVTRNVFCVNVDAVLAVISLKLIYNDLQNKSISLKQVQDLVFTLFLLGRSIGVVAEIADHQDRGLDMDCRTPQKEIGFVL
jgi:succinyl-CoA synthetase alpha subunit/citrate synthase